MNYRKSAIVGVFLGVFLLNTLPHVYAINVTMESNTDICRYDGNLDKDYCKTEYKICDVVFDANKTNFLFKEERGEYKFEMDSDELTTEIKIEPDGGCHKIEIVGYKNPIMNIDNVFCYDGRCFYEWVWWNSSYNIKYQIFGSWEGTPLPFIHINDSHGFNHYGDGNQYIVCEPNVTHFYFNSTSFYACVNDTSLTKSDFMIVLEGNETTYGLSNPNLPTSWWDLNNENDTMQNYNLTPVNSPIRTLGKIGHGQYLNTTILSHFTTGITTIDENFTLMCWVQTNTGGKSVFGKKGVGSSEFIGLIDADGTFILRVGTGTFQSNDTNVDIADNNFHHVVFRNNNTNWSAHVDGIERATLTNIVKLADPTDLDIGSRGDGFDTLDGIIDECIFYDHPLTDLQIENYFNNTVGTDDFAILNNLSFNVTPVVPGLPEEVRFCFDNESLYVIEKDVADTGDGVFEPYLIRCNYGCSNWTLTTLGYPGCQESDFLLSIIMILVVIAIVLIIRGVAK